jgi:hypothetical protein
MKHDELEIHARSCLGRDAPLPTLPMGAPVIVLPTTAVVAEASQERLEEKEKEQKVELIEDIPVLPLVGPSSTPTRQLTVEEVDKAVGRTSRGVARSEAPSTNVW